MYLEKEKVPVVSTIFWCFRLFWNKLCEKYSKIL